MVGKGSSPAGVEAIKSPGKKKQPRILLLVSGVEFARNVSNRFLGKDLAFGNILPLGSSSEFRLGSIKNTIQGYMSKMGW